MPKSAIKFLTNDHGVPEDLRVRRTRRLLSQALIELTKEQPFETITARDVTTRAEIGYATFFRHYGSPADLMRSIVDDLLTDLQKLLPPLSGRDPQQAGTLVFQHARNNAEMYSLLLQADRSLDLISRAVESGRQSIVESYEAQAGSNVPLEIAANHIIYSFITLIEWWFAQGMPYEPERMGMIFRDLIMDPTERVALQLRTKA